MSGKGNRGFADLLVGEGTHSPGAARLPPRTGILSSRENRLSELAGGHAVTRVHELVDPARCRIWDGHNREYTALSETSCTDLIESMKAQGRQEVPAIVRRSHGDPAADYEVICGARRHWTVSWLRTHDYPEFRFLVEPRELSDEEAFRIADLENRSRKDLSDYERAADYARAIERYYDGSQQRMADRLQVTKSWLSRYLELAKLPAGVVAAFPSPHVIGISHAATLAPLLRTSITRKQVEALAEVIAAEQEVRRSTGKAPIKPAKVVSQLTERTRPARPPLGRAVIKGKGTRVLARAERSRSGDITVSIPASARLDYDQVIERLAEVLRRLA